MKASAYRSAFWGSFWEGAASPTMIYKCPHHPRYAGSLETTWKRVGSYIYESIDRIDSEVKAKTAHKARAPEEERIA
jgi:hypothetical protein